MNSTERNAQSMKMCIEQGINQRSREKAEQSQNQPNSKPSQQKLNRNGASYDGGDAAGY